jgi:hypothetical protein
MQIRLMLFDTAGTVLAFENAESLRVRLGPDFQIVGNGVNVLREQVNLGIKASGISYVSKVLGGGSPQLVLRPIPADVLRPLFRAAESPTRLYSGYQVFALLIGQGNYTGTSDRVGATLPGAPASAQMVARHLKSLQPILHEQNVQVITSRKGVVDFDKGKPLTKAELKDAVVGFAAACPEIRRK